MQEGGGLVRCENPHSLRPLVFIYQLFSVFGFLWVSVGVSTGVRGMEMGGVCGQRVKDGCAGGPVRGRDGALSHRHHCRFFSTFSLLSGVLFRVYRIQS